MTATDPTAIVNWLAARGIALAVENEQLRVRSRAPLPPAVRDRLRAHKGVLLAHLRGAHNRCRANTPHDPTAETRDAAVAAAGTPAPKSHKCHPATEVGSCVVPVVRAHETVCTTHDDSDNRSAGPERPDPDADPGPSDDRTDAPDDRPPPPASQSARTADPETSCAQSGAVAAGRLSESSCVVHERERPRAGAPTPPAPAVDRRTEKAVVGTAVVGSTAVTGIDAPVPGRVHVTDPADLARVVAAVRAAPRVGLDLETTGLSHAEHRVRLLALAAPGVTFLVDLFRVDPTPLWPALADARLVGHNLGFDLPFLMRLGFVPGTNGGVRDTMLASQVLRAGDRTAAHGLKDLARRHLNVELDKELQTADWSAPLTPPHLEYAARDAELPVRLWDVLAPLLAQVGLTGTAESECAALPAVAWAARHGIALDRAAWEAAATAAETRAADLREQLDALAPNPHNLFGTTNWNSADAVTGAFRGLGLELASTNDDALAALDHPAAEVLRAYRAAAKLSGTYGRDWLRHVSNDGRVYATWKQIGAGASGRMSCRAPNLQQLPRNPIYRRCFVAPPGRALVKADYSQIELRIAAKISGDARMLAAYRAGEDLHTTTARAVLGKTEVTKADRQLAKSLNFGLLYGMGAPALAAYAASNFGVALTRAEAEAHRAAFFRTYPGLRAWHRSVPNGPRDTRTLGGRRRAGVTAFTEKLNTPTQGTGADGLKRALALLWERRDRCPEAFPVLLVHDEIVVECAVGREEEAAVWVRDAMRDGMAPLIAPVPVEVEVSAVPTWAAG